MKVLVLITALLFAISYGHAFDAEKLYTTTCATCHTIGGGDKIGPDLAEVGKRRTIEWLHKYINYPDGMINGDAEEPGYEKPDAAAKAVYELYKPQLMPEQAMTKEQVVAMVKYIDSKGKKPQGKILKADGKAAKPAAKSEAPKAPVKK